jgi:sigma-B regulation protein RsbU (phosphoserine phosphatase)
METPLDENTVGITEFFTADDEGGGPESRSGGERFPLDPAATIKRYEGARKGGEVLGKLCSSAYYVRQSENVDAFANELDKRGDISAVGVVDDEGRVVGLVVRKELFDILGKTYGRDIFKKRMVKEVMSEARCFDEELSILAAAGILDNELKVLDNRFYVLVNRNNEFTGVFSSKSILIYLSEITQKDLELAHRLQASIVKEEEHFPRDRCEILCVARMARGVGGDFYTVKEYGKGRWVLSLCDVSGKGMSASLLTSILGGMFNSYDFHGGIKPFVRKLNDYILATFELERFITAIIVDFDDRTGELLICDMGHSYIYTCGPGGVKKLNTHKGNVPVGIDGGMEPVLNNYRLAPGETLFLITDGLVEQVDGEGREYGLRRIFERFTGTGGRGGLSAFKSGLLEDIERFRGDEPLSDDLTFVLLSYFGEGHRSSTSG